MICILDPLTCGFTKVFVYELFTNDFAVRKRGNRKHWQGEINRARFDKFKERYQAFDNNENSYKNFYKQISKNRR